MVPLYRREIESKHPTTATEGLRGGLRPQSHCHGHLLPQEKGRPDQSRPEDLEPGDFPLPTPRPVHRDQLGPNQRLRQRGSLRVSRHADGTQVRGIK